MKLSVNRDQSLWDGESSLQALSFGDDVARVVAGGSASSIAAGGRDGWSASGLAADA